MLTQPPTNPFEYEKMLAFVPLVRTVFVKEPQQVLFEKPTITTGAHTVRDEQTHIAPPSERVSMDMKKFCRFVDG